MEFEAYLELDGHYVTDVEAKKALFNAVGEAAAMLKE
jgi:hypothetical protein